MPIDHWNKRPDGKLLIAPAKGYETAIAPFMVLLRLRYEQVGQQGGSQADALQLALTSDQAKELGQALAQAARAVDAETAGTRQ